RREADSRPHHCASGGGIAISIIAESHGELARSIKVTLAVEQGQDHHSAVQWRRIVVPFKRTSVGIPWHLLWNIPLVVKELACRFPVDRMPVEGVDASLHGFGLGAGRIDRRQ